MSSLCISQCICNGCFAHFSFRSVVFILRQRCFLEEKWEVYRGTQCFLNVFFGPGIKTQRLIYQIHVLLPELIELMNWLNWIELKQGLHLHGFSALYRSIPWFGHAAIVGPYLRLLYAYLNVFAAQGPTMLCLRLFYAYLHVLFGPGIKTQRLIDQIHVSLPELIELMNWLNWTELKQGLHLHGFSALLCAALFLQLLCLS